MSQKIDSRKISIQVPTAIRMSKTLENDKGNSIRNKLSELENNMSR